MSNNFNLNEDCYLYGTVVSSEVTTASLATNDIGRLPVYSVEIKPEQGVTDSLALMYGMCTGMHCLNSEEIHKQFSNSKTLTFESLNKPYVSGVDPSTGEFNEGQKVKVSCRFEFKQTDSKTENGYYATPRLMLRFVDADVVAPEEPVEVDWTAVYAAYDF